MRNVNANNVKAARRAARAGDPAAVKALRAARRAANSSDMRRRSGRALVNGAGK